MTVRRSGPGFTRLSSQLASLDGLQAKVGWFADSRYPDGTPVAMVAAVHEFGAPSAGIPPRPTMRPTAAAKSAEWLGRLADGAVEALEGKIEAVTVLEQVALLAAGDVSKAIASLTSPALAEETVARKGFAKPLVDTGLMFKSVTGVVERNGTETVRYKLNADSGAPR